MSESNNNTPMRITQLEEATSYPEGSYIPIAKAGSGTFKIKADVPNPPLVEFAYNIRLPIQGEESKQTVIYAQGSDGVGNIGPYSATDVLIFTLKDGYKYKFTSSNNNAYLALSNYKYSGSIITWNKKINGDGNGNIEFVNTTNHKYAYIYCKGDGGTYTINAWEYSPIIERLDNLEAECEINTSDITKLKEYQGIFQELEIETIQGKYIFGEPNDSRNGSIQNSYNQVHYVMLPVEEGDILKISTLSNVSVPFATYFSSMSPSPSTYISTVKFDRGATVYNEKQIIIPSGVKAIGINTTDENNYPIIVSKFIATKTLTRLYELNLEDLAKTYLEYYGKEIAIFDKILCIGDSITEGGINGDSDTPHGTQTRTVTDQMYSYPTFLSRMYGVNTVNMGRSGFSSKTWYNTYINTDLSGYDCAIIELGTNDPTIDPDPETAVEESYMYLNNIITKLRTDNPFIPIFMCTTLAGWITNSAGEGVYNNILTICEEQDNVYLIDLYKYSKLLPDTPYRTNHPTDIGYVQMAREIGGAIGYRISENLSSFKWVRSVGTIVS